MLILNYVKLPDSKNAESSLCFYFLALRLANFRSFTTTHMQGCIFLVVASVIFKISTMEGGHQQIQKMNIDVEFSNKIEIDPSFKLDQFCLRFPSLDKKICNHLDAQSFLKFHKVRKEVTDGKYFWPRNLQNQLRKLYMEESKIPNDWRYVANNSPLKIVRKFSRTLKQFYKFSSKNKYCTVKCSPLHIAAECGNLELCHYIIDRVEDKNPKDLCGETPLHWAAEKGHYEVCKLILEKISDKNPKDFYGNTPLQIAAEYGNLKLCKPNGEAASNDDLELCSSIILKWKYRNTNLHTKPNFIEICHLIIKEVNYSNLERKNSKSSTAPASSENQKVEEHQTSEKSASPTSNSIIAKKENYIKHIEQLKVGAAPETEKEKSPIVPALKIKKCSKLESSVAEPNNDSRIVEDLSIKLNQSKPEVKARSLKFYSRNLKQKNSKSSTAPASSEKQKVEEHQTSEKLNQSKPEVKEPSLILSPRDLKQKTSKSSTAPSSSEEQKVEQPQTSKNLPIPTSNLIDSKKKHCIKPTEQLEVEAAPETEKEKSPKVPVLKIKLPRPPKPKETLLNVLTDMTKNPLQVEDLVFENPEKTPLVLLKPKRLFPIEQLEVEAALETEKEKSPKFPVSPKPKESLLNILTNFAEKFPQVEDPVFEIPEETPLVLPKSEVKNDDKKDVIISDHIKLTEALEIVGNKVEEIVESKPNIHPDGPTIRVVRKNRGYIKKRDFVHF